MTMPNSSSQDLTDWPALLTDISNAERFDWQRQAHALLGKLQEVLRADLAVTDGFGREFLAKGLIAPADLVASHPEEFPGRDRDRGCSLGA